MCLYIRCKCPTRDHTNGRQVHRHLHSDATLENLILPQLLSRSCIRNQLPRLSPAITRNSSEHCAWHGCWSHQVLLRLMPWHRFRASGRATSSRATRDRQGIRSSVLSFVSCDRLLSLSIRRSEQRPTIPPDVAGIDFGPHVSLT